MAPISSTLMSSGSRKKEPRCACLSEAKASHSHKMCAEVSSSVPHFLHVGLSLSPITCRCLLRVLCPVRRPITALVCVLLKDSSRAPVARSGPEHILHMPMERKNEWTWRATSYYENNINIAWMDSFSVTVCPVVECRYWRQLSKGDPELWERYVCVVGCVGVQPATKLPNCTPSHFASPIF